MEVVYRRRAGVLVEPLGPVWVAFSPANGETVLLNDASAALLEVLDEGPATADQAGRMLAQETGDDPVDLRDVVAQSWGLLTDAGLVVAGLPGQHPAP